MPTKTKWALLAGALLSFCFIPSLKAQVAPTVNPAPNVPTPESVLGHKPGDDFYLANYDESRDYFHKLAAVSDRIKMISVGKTTRGLDWEIAIISSPRNLAQLDKYKDIARRLSITEGTAKTHVKAILTKLDAISRTEAVAVAHKRGLVRL